MPDMVPDNIKENNGNGVSRVWQTVKDFFFNRDEALQASQPLTGSTLSSKGRLEATHDPRKKKPQPDNQTRNRATDNSDGDDLILLSGLTGNGLADDAGNHPTFGGGHSGGGGASSNYGNEAPGHSDTSSGGGFWGNLFSSDDSHSHDSGSSDYDSSDFGGDDGGGGDDRMPGKRRKTLPGHYKNRYTPS